jgi:phosphoesterase RecJ-like protein
MDINQKFLRAIEGKTNIVISTHSFPDADGIGSQISLCLALRDKGVNTICCNDEKLLERYKYLDLQDVVHYVDEMPQLLPKAPDLVIVVDTNTIQRTGKNFIKYYEQYNCDILYIDHHPCAEEASEDHCINTKAAATGQLVGELIDTALQISLTQEMALPLYTAILIDTSSFRYPTVTAATHKMIAKLMATGIKPPQAYNGIYGTKKLQHIHLLGKILSSANSTYNEEIAWIILKKDELEHYDVDIEDTHAFINNLLILDNVKVACMFRDDGDQVKISMRSSGIDDVGEIAIALGGGGHAHSAATIIKKTETETLSNIISDVISRIEVILN